VRVQTGGSDAVSYLPRLELMFSAGLMIGSD
jgi:hypothetical protein